MSVVLAVYFMGHELSRPSYVMNQAQMSTRTNTTRPRKSSLVQHQTRHNNHLKHTHTQRDQADVAIFTCCVPLVCFLNQTSPFPPRPDRVYGKDSSQEL